MRSVAPSEQGSSATWRLAAWTCVTHVAAVLLCVREASATGLPLLVVLALVLLAVAIGASLLVWCLRSAADARTADLYFWSYGATALLMACAAGATIALLVFVSSSGMQPVGTKVAPPVLTALAMLDLYQVLEAARMRDRDRQARLLVDDPARAALVALLLASAVGCVAAALAIVLAGEMDLGAALMVAEVVVVLAASVVAVHLALELRQRLTGTAASGDVIRRRLLVALDAAAMRSGAIRQISAVDAHYVGPSALRVILHIDFKAGVSAEHIAPVLEKLRTAATAEIPEVVDIVLAPPPRASEGP